MPTPLTKTWKATPALPTRNKKSKKRKIHNEAVKRYISNLLKPTNAKPPQSHYLYFIRAINRYMKKENSNLIEAA